MTLIIPGKTGLILDEPLLFELDATGNGGISLPPMDVPDADIENIIPKALLRDEIEDFPQLSEPTVVRHFTRLSTRNYSLDGGFYPLGSCTMKYNPRICELASSLDGFLEAHPYQSEQDSQGILQLMWRLEKDLAEISGMDAVTLHPSAGSHGELLGMMLIRAYHADNGGAKRSKVIIPDSAHGTNPSSAALCGYEAVTLNSGKDGLVDLAKLDELMTDEVAAIMLTNPNTCGLFESRILEICALVHKKGGLVYMDGANMNAMVGIARPGDMGADVLHFNTHKTFSTPHGGGGPGSGPVGMKALLEPYLPKPVLVMRNDMISLEEDRPKSIGKIRTFYGNIGVLIRAYTYLKTVGNSGLREIAETAVLNANYLQSRLKEHYHLPFPDSYCMHEVLFTDANQKGHTMTMDIAKGLIELGFHPPTVYFPMIVQGAMLIEPTETESKETMDRFVSAMIMLSEKSKQGEWDLHEFPKKSFVERVDEVQAARKPIIAWKKEDAEK